jgi:hypothetical protein
MQFARQQQAYRLPGNVAKFGSGHVIGHLQINHRPAILPASDLAECLGAVWIGVKKTKPACTCGRTAGGSSSCFTLASLHNCSFHLIHFLSNTFFGSRKNY